MSCFDRRMFLKSGLMASAAAALPSFFTRALLAGEPGDRVLVLVQLEGGNDGLNTVAPVGDDAYHRARPGLRLRAEQALPLDDHRYVGFHPALKGLHRLFEDGRVAVVQGVGYPNPNRSHFTSTDIWQTASTVPPERWNGWLGRALDRCTQGDVPGLHLDPGPLSLALVGERVVVPTVANADRFRLRGGGAALLNGLAARPRDDRVAEYVRRSAEQAYKTSARIERALRGRDAEGYPGTDLGRRLWQIARLIEADMPARVYSVRLSGFDTHSRQQEAHATLLRTLGDALAAFQADLRRHRLDGRVLTMTYSEFGRRVKENRSLGTDHGAAAPMFVVGGAIRGGLYGAHPSLTDLGDGDLKFHTDFRQVYATILDRWLKVDSQAVLGKRYEPVPFV